MSHLSTFLLMAHLKLVSDSSSSGLNGNTILVSIWNADVSEFQAFVTPHPHVVGLYHTD